MTSIGSPDSLLRRWPDIRVAERSLAAATANIGVAVSDLFPRVTFNGNIGLQATTISELGGAGVGHALLRPFAHGLRWTSGRCAPKSRPPGRRRTRSSRSMKNSVDKPEETENALVDYGRDQARRDFLRESVQASAALPSWPMPGTTAGRPISWPSRR